ncbi:MAG: alpha/beta fold hydrolase [Bacteroidota bacterium]
MKKTFLIIAVIGLVIMAFNETENLENPEIQNFKTVQFPSLDGIMISANIYEVSVNEPVILLCHQARYNKYEYEDIAPKLNAKGFNCIAIDQRSGGELRNHQNITHQNAIKKNKPTEYLDAEQDIIAAIDYVYKKYKIPIILWGSSYSSTLALYIANNNEKIAAVVSFSPGNYFADQKGSLIDKMENFKKPMFVTSSKKEVQGVNKLLQKMKLNEKQVQFIPTGSGFHGSKALWDGQKGGEEYWNAMDDFLNKIK